MPVISPRKGDLGLRNFRDESIRRLAISFLKDCTELPSLIRKIKEIYAPQTKILEDGTKDEMQIFEVLFNGS